MDFSFEDAVPVKRGGPGRTPEPNPFVDAVKEIALQVDPETNLPIAKSFTVPVKNEEDEVRLNKFKNQLHAAGALVNPQVTVNKHIERDGKGKAKITFWTVKRQTRPRKTETAPA